MMFTEEEGYDYSVGDNGFDRELEEEDDDG